MILVVLLYAICALMFTVSKWALSTAEPIFFMSIRMILAGALLFLWAFIRENLDIKTILTKIKEHWIVFGQLVLFHVYLVYICDLCALKNISSSESAFLYNLSPFVSALFSYILLNERMSYKKWIGLLLGSSSLFMGFSASFSWPHFLTLIAVLSGSYGWILVKKLVQIGYSPIFINSFAMFSGGLIALVTSRLMEPWSPVPVYDWHSFIKATFLIVVIANIIFYNLYGYLLKKYSATFLSFAGFLCPVFTSLFGYMFLQESISPQLIVSFLLSVIGLFIFYQEELYSNFN